MSSRTPAILACAGSAIGLAVALPAHLSKPSLEKLCSQESSCTDVFSPTFLGADTSAWVLGIFLGLAWASASFLLGRKGYQTSGKALLILGAASLIFFSLRLRSTGDCLPCNAALGGAALVVIGGFLGRKEDLVPSNRSTGVFIAFLVPILLVNGVLNERDAFAKKLTPFADVQIAPEIGKLEFIWNDIGSKSISKNIAILYADYSDPRAAGIREAVKKFSAENGGSILLIHRPVPEKGSNISARALHCAPRNHAHKMAQTLSAARQQRDEATIVAIAKQAGFQTDSYQACLESDATASKVKQAITPAKDANIKNTFHLLINKDTTWKMLKESKRTGAEHWKHIRTNGDQKTTLELLKEFFKTPQD